MAKQEFDLGQYTELLLKNLGDSLPAEKLAVFKEVLGHEKVAPVVRETVLMKSEASRLTQKLLEDQKALDAKTAEAQQFYASQIAADHNNKALFDAMNQELTDLRSRNADPYAAPPPKPEERPMTQKELDAWWTNRQKELLNFTSKNNTLLIKHYGEFGTVLDTDNLFKLALDQGVPIEVAYEQMTRDARAERATKDIEKRIEEARAAGATEALSKHKIPTVDNQPRGIHALKRPADFPKTSADRVNAAVDAWNAGKP